MKNENNETKASFIKTLVNLMGVAAVIVSSAAAVNLYNKFASYVKDDRSNHSDTIRLTGKYAGWEHSALITPNCKVLGRGGANLEHRNGTGRFPGVLTLSGKGADGCTYYMDIKDNGKVKGFGIAGGGPGGAH